MLLPLVCTFYRHACVCVANICLNVAKVSFGACSETSCNIRANLCNDFTNNRTHLQFIGFHSKDKPAGKI